MHEWSAVYARVFYGACKGSPGKFLNLDSLKYHFPDFGKRFYRIMMV
jgi:hypothetical protein